MLVLVYILLCELYFIYCERKLPKWGNYVDALVQSSSTNALATTLKMALYVGNTLNAERQWSIRIHPPPSIPHNFSLSYNFDAWRTLPDILRNEQIHQYIRSLQFARTRHLLTDVWSKTICIHMRLGDVPIGRNPHYQLSSFQWYKNAILAAQTRVGKQNVCIITKFNDRTSKDICKLYEDELGCPSIQGSEEEAIYALMNCAAVITTCGSFGFYAALASNNVWISPIKIHLRKHMMYVQASTIAHTDVDNYTDTTSLQLLLNKK